MIPVLPPEAAGAVVEELAWKSSTCSAFGIGCRLPMVATLPVQLAHADWGSDRLKRQVATARLVDGAYVAQAPRPFGSDGSLLERMHLDLAVRGPALLGFDFPIGVPVAYARLAGIENFASWFRTLALDSPFFEVASELEQVSIAQPFFPKRIATKTPGIKAQYREALGLSSSDVLRRCEAAHAGRGAASEMFWTLGPKAVGKATLAGWRDALRPALAESAHTYALWPFDGPLSDLLSRFDAVIVETYPADAYRQLGLRMGLPGTAKTSQEHRRADGPPLLEWCSNAGVVLDAELVHQIEDGFGPSKSGEDPFDAVIGLLGMINTIQRTAEPDLPDDATVRHLEGWMFGRPKSDAAAFVAARFKASPKAMQKLRD